MPLTKIRVGESRKVRRAKNLTKVFIAMGAFLLGCAALLTAALYQLAGASSVESLAYYTPQDSARMAMLDPVDPSMLGVEAMAEKFVRQYIYTRYTVIDDRPLMALVQGQGGTLHWLSAPAVYLLFARDNGLLKPKNDASNIGKDKQALKPVEVAIRAVRMADARPVRNPYTRRIIGFVSLWQVEFDTVSSGEARTHRMASLMVRAIPARRRYANAGYSQYRRINPLGFTVVEFNDSIVN
ncbi:hypothetical protein FACS1894186_0520 [Alphaproteobacteria bacterium]|nr:hypothetical protein FACS1894186_0520 [Alphaproteobacteria bacterium]